MIHPQFPCPPLKIITKGDFKIVTIPTSKRVS